MIDGVPHLVDCETSMREDGLPCGCITHDVVEAVMSSLSDHDRAVAADALRQAADDFPTTHGTDEIANETRRYLYRLGFEQKRRIKDWLRARAEAGADTRDDEPDVATVTTALRNMGAL